MARLAKFMSSSIPSWQIITAHAQPFRGARDLAFRLNSLLVWASSGGSGETAQMRRLAWTFAARTGVKYQIRLTRPIWYFFSVRLKVFHRMNTKSSTFVHGWNKNHSYTKKIHFFFFLFLWCIKTEKCINSAQPSLYIFSPLSIPSQFGCVQCLYWI